MMKISDRHKPWVIASAVVVIIISVIIISRTPSSERLRDYTKKIDPLAEFAAAETADFLGKGKRVVVIAYDAQDSQLDKTQQSSFRGSIEDAGIEVKTLESLVLEAADKERAEVNGGFPAEMYRRIFEDYPEVDAYVSLCGPPWDLPDASDPVPEIVPPLIVALGLSPEINIEPLFDHGILEMAVTLRPRHSLDPKTAPRRGRAMFDYYYQVVTAASGE